MRSASAVLPTPVGPTIKMLPLVSLTPLVSAPWRDEERLFRVGQDFLMVESGEEAEAAMRRLLHDPEEREALRRSGLETIRARHTCAHRVDELLGIVAGLRPEALREALPEARPRTRAEAPAARAST